jgi:hypothetical protein
MPQTTEQLKAAIMNLPLALDRAIERPTQYEAAAYAKGHRDARHAAAELVSAVPLVAEAPRGPLYWIHRHNRGNGKTQDVIVSDADRLIAYRDTLLEEIPLYAALPASLAPMPENWQLKAQHLASRYGLLCGTDTDNAAYDHQARHLAWTALLSHLRTAPRPTLSDEQICWYASDIGNNDPVNDLDFRTNPDHWFTFNREMLLEFARAVLAASASPQQPEQKPDAHLAANRESAVQGVDAAARSVVTDAMVEAGALVLCGEEAFKDAGNAAWGRDCARKVLTAAAGVPASLTPGCGCPGNGEFLLKHHALKCHYRLRSIGVDTSAGQQEKNHG